MLCLVFSSFLFIVPALYAYTHGMLLYAALLSTTSLVSANYWRDPFTPSWRKVADLVVAKVSFATFVISGILYVRDLRFMLVAYPGLIALIYCYYESCAGFCRGNEGWYVYHFAFHVVMTCELIIILVSCCPTHQSHLSHIN